MSLLTDIVWGTFGSLWALAVLCFWVYLAYKVLSSKPVLYTTYLNPLVWWACVKKRLKLRKE